MTTSTLPRRRSAYGLDSDRPDDWRTAAACAGMADLFTGFLPTQVDEQAKASHVCRHCSVRVECELLALGYRTSGVVQAGKVWRDGRPNDLPDPGCGSHCAHLRRDGHGRS